MKSILLELSVSELEHGHMKYTGINSLRLVVMIFVVIFTFDHEYLLYKSICIGNLVFSALWLIAEEFRYIDVSKYPRLSWVATSSDLIMVALVFFMTGTVNSFINIGFLLVTAVCCLNLKTGQGLFSAIVSILFYVSISLMVLLGLFPDINILGAENGVTLQAFLISSVLFTAANIAVYLLVTELMKRNKNLYLEVEDQKHKNEELLLNILPYSTVKELQLYGRSIPRKVNQATIFFSDFVNFTNISKGMLAEDLVDKLDGFFTFFDKTLEQYQIEKLKTIGDGYMAVSGVLGDYKQQAVNMCNAALDILEYMKIHELDDKNVWNVRIGINTGQVIAGIIGKSKFSYDVWGQAVNLAARLESASESGKINISQETYALTKDVFEYEYRGKISVKGIEGVDMYYLVGRKE